MGWSHCMPRCSLHIWFPMVFVPLRFALPALCLQLSFPVLRGTSQSTPLGTVLPSTMFPSTGAKPNLTTALPEPHFVPTTCQHLFLFSGTLSKY